MSARSTLAAVTLGLLAAVPLADLASANTARHRPNIKAGGSDIIWNSGRVDFSICKTIDPRIARPTIIRKAEHGKTQVTRRTQAFHSMQGNTPCEGKPYLANVIIYTPKAGFRGEDSVEIEVSYPDTGSQRTTILLTVE